MNLICLCLFLSLPSPNEILQKADHFRSPEGAFIAQVEVIDDDGTQSAFEVFIEGNEKSLIVTKAPQRDLGRNMLMLDQEMWMFLPSVNRAVRIALKQKLTGQVAQGDLSRMKWVGDYEPKLINNISQIPNGAKGIQLELKAKKENLTYDLIQLWVDPKDFRPLYAEYQTLAGKTLKASRFENYGPLAGATRIKEYKIIDSIRSDKISTLKISEMKQTKFPKGFFTQSNLAKPKAP